MRNTIVSLAAGVLLIASPLVVSAQSSSLPTVPAHASVEQLQALIVQLIAILQQLINERNHGGGVSSFVFWDPDDMDHEPGAQFTLSLNQVARTNDSTDMNYFDIKLTSISTSGSGKACINMHFVHDGASLVDQNECFQDSVSRILTITAQGDTEHFNVRATLLGKDRVQFRVLTDRSSNPGGKVGFWASPDEGKAPLAVTYRANVGGPGYVIDFGDGVFSGIYADSTGFDCANIQECYAAPAHTYTKAGAYTAKLEHFDYTKGIDCRYQSCDVVGSITVTAKKAVDESVIFWDPDEAEHEPGAQFTLSLNQIARTNDSTDMNYFDIKLTSVSTGGSGKACINMHFVHDGASLVDQNECFQDSVSRILTITAQGDTEHFNVRATLLGKDRVQFRVIIGEKDAGAATLKLAGPSSGSTFTVGQSIPVSWAYTNAPANSQVVVSMQNIAPSTPSSGVVGGGTWQSPLVSVGNGSGSYDKKTGPSYMDFTGTYKITAQLKQCDPHGCNYFYNNPTLKTYATSEPVIFTLASKSSVDDVRFTASTKSGAAPLTVSFASTRALPEGAIDAGYYVDFGDGTTHEIHCAVLSSVGGDTCVSPAGVSHTYSAAGTYTAKLMFGGMCPIGSPCTQEIKHITITVSN